MSFFKKLKTDIEGKEETVPKEEKTTEKAEPAKKLKIKLEEMTDHSAQTEKRARSKKGSREWLNTEGQLAVDVYQTATDFYVVAPIAGVDLNDLEVSAENSLLIIKGERKPLDEPKEEKEYFYRECYWGPFSRQIILPEDADANRTKAVFKKGVLTIKIPRVTKIQKKKISIVSQE